MADRAEPLADLRLPLRIHNASDEAFGIRDAMDRSICYIYYDYGCPARRSVRLRITKAQAEAVAKAVARALTRAVEAAGVAPRPRR